MSFISKEQIIPIISTDVDYLHHFFQKLVPTIAQMIGIRQNLPHDYFDVPEQKSFMPIGWNIPPNCPYIVHQNKDFEVARGQQRISIRKTLTYWQNQELSTTSIRLSLENRLSNINNGMASVDIIGIDKDGDPRNYEALKIVSRHVAPSINTRIGRLIEQQLLSVTVIG